MKKNKSKSSRGASLATLARPYASAALAELARIMTRSRSDLARVAASNALLDRGFGKPPPSQSLATTDVERLLRVRNNMSSEELIEYYKKLRSIPAGEFLRGKQ
jgi:hypothetical protein